MLLLKNGSDTEGSPRFCVQVPMKSAVWLKSWK